MKIQGSIDEQLRALPKDDAFPSPHSKKEEDDFFLKSLPRSGASGDNLPSFKLLEIFEKDQEEDEVHIERWDLEEPSEVPNESWTLPHSQSKEYKSNDRVESVIFHPVMEMPSIISMKSTEDEIDDSFNSTTSKFIGEFTIENKTDQHYGFKIMCNESSIGMYEATPNMECIPPFQSTIVRVETVKGANLSSYLAKSDTLIVRGHRLGGPVDKTTLKKFMNRMAVVWPRIGEKFELKPFLLELGRPDVLDAVDLQQPTQRKMLIRSFDKEMKERRLPNRRLGVSISTLDQQLHSSELEIRRTLEEVQTIQFRSQLLMFAVGTIALFFYILPSFRNLAQIKLEPVIVNEVEYTNRLYYLWSIVRNVGEYLYSKP